MKAAWIAAFGPKPELGQALGRLEIIADTFLSMNAPVQCALPEWLAGRERLQAQISARVEENLRRLDTLLSSQTMVSRLEVEAGWYAVLRVPALESGEDLALRLIRDHGVSIHPGYFFGFGGDGWLVVSLLTRVSEFLAGIDAICSFFNEMGDEFKA